MQRKRSYSRLVIFIGANVPQGSSRLPLCPQAPELHQPQQCLQPPPADHVVVSVLVGTELTVDDSGVVLALVVQ